MCTTENFRDEELQALAVSGDAEAEEALIQRYKRVVRSAARPYFLAGGDSEDLLQEGLMGLLSAIRTYQSGQGASFHSYSVLCIRRRIISAIRSASGKKNVSLDECLSLESSLFDEVQPQSHEQRSPEDILIHREDMQMRYRELLRQCSDFESRVFRCFLRGMSYHEIAETTGRTEKAVDNAVQRIRRKLSSTP